MARVKYIIGEVMEFLDIIQKESCSALYDNHSMDRDKVSSLRN